MPSGSILNLLSKHLQLILVSLVKTQHSHTKALLWQVILFKFS